VNKAATIAAQYAQAYNQLIGYGSMSWLRCQKIGGLEYWVQLLFNFTPVSACKV